MLINNNNINNNNSSRRNNNNNSNNNNKKLLKLIKQKIKFLRKKVRMFFIKGIVLVLRGLGRNGERHLRGSFKREIIINIKKLIKI